MRDIIGQAENVLSKRFSITIADAYVLLLQLAARQEDSVRSAAEQLVQQGARVTDSGR
jgi:ANTAR domain